MITYLPANIDDVQTFQDLNDEVFVDNSKYDSDLKIDWAQSEVGREYFADVVSNPENICLIVKDGERPVGYAVAEPKIFGYRLSKYMEIDNMGVSPDYRSKGIGTELIRRVTEIAKEKGYQKIFVNAYWGNTKAVSFYEKNGFEKIDVGLEKVI
jgi:ribosomal protein S18 acetylase RimI-like enzyme